jgi:hypothetical protein
MPLDERVKLLREAKGVIEKMQNPSERESALKEWLDQYELWTDSKDTTVPADHKPTLRRSLVAEYMSILDQQSQAKAKRDNLFEDWKKAGLIGQDLLQQLNAFDPKQPINQIVAASQLDREMSQKRYEEKEKERLALVDQKEQERKRAESMEKEVQDLKRRLDQVVAQSQDLIATSEAAKRLKTAADAASTSAPAVPAAVAATAGLQSTPTIGRAAKTSSFLDSLMGMAKGATESGAYSEVALRRNEQYAKEGRGNLFGALIHKDKPFSFM